MFDLTGYANHYPKPIPLLQKTIPRYKIIYKI